MTHKRMTLISMTDIISLWPTPPDLIVLSFATWESHEPSDANIRAWGLLAKRPDLRRQRNTKKQPKMRSTRNKQNTHKPKEPTPRGYRPCLVETNVCCWHLCTPSLQYCVDKQYNLVWNVDAKTSTYLCDRVSDQKQGNYHKSHFRVLQNLIVTWDGRRLQSYFWCRLKAETLTSPTTAQSALKASMVQSQRPQHRQTTSTRMFQKRESCYVFFCVDK